MTDLEYVRGERPQKCPRSRSARRPIETVCEDVTSVISASQRSHISHWAEQGIWPKTYFRSDGMRHLLARPKSTPSLQRKKSGSSITSTTPSDQKPREEKSAPYKNASYTALLEIQGHSYMREDELGVSEKSERLCQVLLEAKQLLPKDTLFRDDKTFKNACNRLEGKNEARIFKDLTPLLVPFAETLAVLGAKHLDIVVESVNEGWNSCVPVTKPRPQPDYALGFGRSAFSDVQLDKLQPFTGNPSDLSYFKATYYMYFPFLTCEVECGATGLDIADRQNAHSMTVALKGVVELFKGVGREKEIHRQILGFSYSHDHESIRIWGHYPVIDAETTTFRRHPIRKFNFTERKGLERWIAYTITKNLYRTWAPLHFKRICSVIDDLPEEEMEIAQASGSHASEITGLS